MNKKVCQSCPFLGIMGKNNERLVAAGESYCRKSGESLEKMRSLPFGCPKVMQHIESKRVAK